MSTELEMRHNDDNDNDGAADEEDRNHSNMSDPEIGDVQSANPSDLSSITAAAHSVATVQATPVEEILIVHSVFPVPNQMEELKQQIALVRRDNERILLERERQQHPGTPEAAHNSDSENMSLVEEEEERSNSDTRETLLERNRGCPRRWKLLTLWVLFLILIALISTVIGLVKPPSPAEEVTCNAQCQGIVGTLSKATGRSLNFNRSSSVAEEQAIVWLVDRNETVPLTAENSTRLFQRFVLLSNFWYDQELRFLLLPWPFDADECAVPGITCNANKEITRFATHNNQDGAAGQVPIDIGLLTSLTHLSSSTQRLAGTLPSSMGQLTNLEHLSLPGSNLTGAIPSEIRLLAKLTHLGLQNNRLRGTIPSTLNRLFQLEEVNLQNNPSLTGTVPFCAMNQTTEVAVQVSADCTLECSCCSDNCAGL